jgi:hypothetical protein
MFIKNFIESDDLHHFESDSFIHPRSKIFFHQISNNFSHPKLNLFFFPISKNWFYYDSQMIDYAEKDIFIQKSHLKVLELH